jgi:hypothetical protein
MDAAAAAGGGGGGAGAGAGRSAAEVLGMNNSAVYPYSPAEHAVFKAAAAARAAALGIVAVDPAAAATTKEAIMTAKQGETVLLYLRQFAMPSFKIQPLVTPSPTFHVAMQRIKSYVPHLLEEMFLLPFMMESTMKQSLATLYELNMNRFNNMIMEILKDKLGYTDKLFLEQFKKLLKTANTDEKGQKFMNGESKLDYMMNMFLVEVERDEVFGTIERKGFIRSDILPHSYSREWPFSFDLHPNLQSAILRKTIKDVYNGAEPISSIPLYLFLLSPKGHASIMVLFESKLYSLGLGLEDVTSSVGEAPVSGQAIFMSPDSLIIPERMTSSGEHYKYKIIDVGILTATHLHRIQELLAYQVPVQTLLFKYNGTDNTYQVDDYTIYLNRTYHYFSMGGGGKKDYLNCVSFAEMVFHERVSCGDWRAAGAVVNPDSCLSTYITTAALTPIAKRFGAEAALSAIGEEAAAAAAAAVAATVSAAYTPAEALLKLYLLAYLGADVSVITTGLFPLLYTPVAARGGARRRKTRRRQRLQRRRQRRQSRRR